jgi:hypothetical protein
MEMFDTNSKTYAANSGRNWSKEDRELNKYLVGEWQYRPYGSRSARLFCTRPGCSARGGIAGLVMTVRGRSHAWHIVNILSPIILLLRVNKTGQGREIG